MDEYTITVRYNPKPMATRAHDWEAWVVDFEEEYRCATGASAGEAVANIGENMLFWDDMRRKNEFLSGQAE